MIHNFRRVVGLLVVLVLSCSASKAINVDGDSSSLMWSKPVAVKRVDKPKRTPPPSKPRPKRPPKGPVVEKIQLLCLRWSVNKGAWADAPDPTKNPKPSNPEESYKVNDHLQLVFTVNQDGYLYIIQEKDLTMVFPDKRINKGDNFVQKDQQIVVPSNCVSEVKDKNGNCWFRVENSDDDLMLIFSRDKIDDLPNSANDEGTVIVKKAVLAEVKSGSRQQFSKTNPNGTMVQFTNLNRNDNEELIIETKIRHQ